MSVWDQSILSALDSSSQGRPPFSPTLKAANATSHVQSGACSSLLVLSYLISFIQCSDNTSPWQWCPTEATAIFEQTTSETRQSPCSTRWLQDPWRVRRRGRFQPPWCVNSAGQACYLPHHWDTLQPPTQRLRMARNIPGQRLFHRQVPCSSVLPPFSSDDDFLVEDIGCRLRCPGRDKL